MRHSLPLFGAALLLAAAAHGQSIDAQKVTFDYVRLPLVPVPAGTHSYSGEVVLRYIESVKQQQADHVSAVAEAKAKAEKDKQEYKAQSLKDKALNRILLDERKPGAAVIPTARLYRPGVRRPHAGRHVRNAERPAACPRHGW